MVTDVQKVIDFYVLCWTTADKIVQFLHDT